MRCFYEADDGTVFDDYDECEEYEKRLKIDNLKTDGLKMWDERGFLTDEFEKCFYLVANTEQAVEYMREIARDYGCETPEDSCCEEVVFGHLYCYDNDRWEWHDIDVELEELQKMKEKFS
ncbi:MAG: hypothetical protein KBT27_01420 [Prevotellaceae bacterium]|nr:hypothetical protein [Candidatus Faecinaster equi]